MSSTAKAIPGKIVRDLYDFATGDEDARVCRDIPESSCNDQPRNFFSQLAALSLTKVGDALADAKLILPWLLASVGAPAGLTGLLVPLRESLSLVPQLAVAAFIRRAPVRKWFWIAGSIGQGIAVVGMGLAAMSMEGAAAGWTIVGLLALFALMRGISSVAAKDVMGKTVSKSRRGRVNGYSASFAGFVTVGLGVWLASAGLDGRPVEFFVVLLAIAGGTWFLAAGVYALLAEAPGATEGGGNALEEAVKQIGLLRQDPDLRRFLLTRAFLMSTGLVAPYYVALAQRSGGGTLAELGLLVTASGLASAVSAPIWGGLADRSSRRLMVSVGLIAAAVGLVVMLAVSMEVFPGGAQVFFTGVIFVSAIAHAGVRLGRKTYLVDMATQENRAAYVALSNTIIGVLLLAAGSLGLVAQSLGDVVVIGVLAAASLAGAVTAFSLKEVQ